MQTRIKKNARQPGHPRAERAAITIEASAKGKANTVCDSFTKPAHFAASR
jgi:hypothetical protein